MKTRGLQASLIVILLSCGTESKKMYIKSIEIDSSRRVDWYFYSLISNFSRSYIQVSNGSDTIKILESFAVTNISINADTLKIQLYKNKYKIDTSMFVNSGLKILIDTTGGIWNQASSRLGRLQGKGVDYFKPHFVESYCPYNECN